MRPAQGDAVKFTDRFLSSSRVNWAPALRDTELLVARIKLDTMVPFKIYTVFLMVNNMMYKIQINEIGHFVENKAVKADIVFEPFHDPVNGSVSVGAPLNPQPVSVPTPAWVPDAPTSAPPAPVSKDEANTTCFLCGAPALDLIFKTKCTNPNCKNYS